MTPGQRYIDKRYPPPRKINLWARLKSIAVTLMVCFGLIGVLAFMQNRDLKVKLEVQQSLAARFVAARYACVNDKFYRSTHLCQKILASNP